MIHNSIPGKYFFVLSKNKIATVKITGITLFILIFLSSSTTFFQNVSALLPVTVITSARVDGLSVMNGGSITLPPGRSIAILNFEFKGFDDDNHVIELQCSFDGVNYLKSNCASQTAESQSTFAGPDGVQRTYNVKTGTAFRQITAPLFFKTYTFGVKVLNDNGNTSPASTWTIKLRANPSTNGGPQGSGTDTESNTKKTRVFFESLAVHNDHDGFGYRPMTCCSGEWSLYALVQGKLVTLMDSNVDGGHTYTLHKSITLDVRADLPFSIFTLGVDNDSFLAFCKVNYPYFEVHVSPIFTLQPTVWKHEIDNFISSWNEGIDCGDNLGVINEFYSPLDHGEGIHKIKSSSGDYTLTFVVSSVTT